MKQRELDIIDLVASVFAHWRGIIVFSIIGAMFIGLVGYIVDISNANDVQTGNMIELTIEEQLAQVESRMTAVQQASVLSAIDDEKEYELRKEYIDKSAIMKMDPYNVHRMELIYKVQMDDVSSEYILGTVYADLINGVGITSWIEEKCGIPAMNVNELISAESQSKITILTSEEYSGMGNDVVKVVIFGSNEAECRELAGLVEEYIILQQDVLIAEFGEHEMILISESYGTIIDLAVSDRQATYNNTLITLLNSSAKLKDAFTADQQAYYDLLTQPATEEGEDVAVEETVEPAEPAKASISIKAVALGAIIGAVLYACAIMFFYVINNRLRASDELTGLYDIPQLGLVVKDNAKLFVVDKWIQSLRNRGKRRFTAEQSLELATTAVKIAALKNGLDNVCLIGCDMEAGANEVCDKLKESLEKDNLKVTILNNVLYDAAAMAQLDDVKGAVLVEKAGSTMYREIADELELVGRQEIKVLGGIVVE